MFCAVGRLWMTDREARHGELLAPAGVRQRPRVRRAQGSSVAVSGATAVTLQVDGRSHL